MRKGSRIIAVLLALVMVFSYRTPVMAEDLPQEEILLELQDDQEQEIVPEEDLDMGQIDDNEDEEIIDISEEPVQEEEETPAREEPAEADEADFAETSGDYTYTLSGEEATITKYAGTTVSALTIPSTLDGYTVTKLGSSVFSRHTELTSVVIPDSVTYIGNSAFYNCTSLKTVKLPASLDEIGSYAFEYCAELTSVTLPQGLTKIRSSAFYGCTGFDTITIPKSVTTIDSGAFSNIKKATFEDGIETIPANSFSGAQGLEQVTIPSSVTVIGNNAFYNCKALKAVSLPSGLTEIGSYAFEYCASLTSIKLPGSLTRVRSNAFYGCTGIESITVPKSLTSIESGAFSSVKKAVFESGTETIPTNSFSGAQTLEEVTIPSSVTVIGNNAFYNCKALKAVSLPSGLTEIGSYAFQYCSSLTSIKLPGSLTRVRSNAFYGCTGIESITIPKTLTSIESGAFNSVKKATFESGTETIPANSFYGAQSLEEVTIPSGVTAIGNYAFYNCKALKEISLPSGLTEIGNSAFQYCTSLTSLTLPGSLTKVKSSAFYGCTGIESINIPKTLTTIESSAFNNVKKVTFDNGTEKIPDNCLSGAQNLQEVTIPSSVTVIGSNAFYNCKALTKITLPAGLTEIGNNAFQYCQEITEIDLPSSVQTLGSGCFNGCSKIESIVVPQGVTSINYSTFNNCTSLKKVTLPDTITVLGGSCFSRCEALEAISIPATVKTIESSAFYYCTSLKTVTIPDGVVVYSNAFSYCSGLKSVVLGNNVTLRGYVFSNCPNIEDITVGEGVSFNKSDFSGLVTSGTIGDITWSVDDLSSGILTISGEGSIPDYEELTARPWHKIKSFVTDIRFNGKNITVGKNAFAGMNNLQSVIMDEGIVKIGENAFKDCKSLVFAELSPDLERIEEGAFAGCTAFEQLILTSETAPEISDDAFGALDILDIFFPFSGVGYTNYLITRFGKITWNPFDDTNGGQEIMLVLDVSGSMAGDRIKGLREAATAFVQNVGGIQNNTKISIVAFDDRAVLLSNATYFQGGLIHQISLLDDGGGTEYKTALMRADEVLSQSKTKHKYLVMFSDGAPNDNKEAIYECAETLRKKYGIFTVGLGAGTYQKEVLEKVAGSEKRYFEASNVAALIEIFKSLAEDIDKEEFTKVELHRNNNWHDIRNDIVKYVVGSKEDTTIKVTPSLGTKNVAKFALAQAGNPSSRMESTTGEFLLVPGKKFKENYDRSSGTINAASVIYVEVIDKDGKVVDTVNTNLAMTDAFVVTYMRNDGTGLVAHTQEVMPWTFFEYDGDEPEREEMFFDGWYEDENASSEYDYFSVRNNKKRYTIEDDVTLYAKWRITDFNFATDAWGFGNTYSVYCTSSYKDYTADETSTTHKYQYDIRESDFAELKKGYSNADKQTFDEEKADYWGGSCFGMAGTALFYNRGLLDLANFDNSKTSPSTVKGSDLPYSSVSAFESLINYYYLLQFDPEISTLRQTYKGIDEVGGESDNLERIVKRFLDDRAPKMLMIKLYTKTTPRESAGGHAVVLYNFQDRGNDRYTFSIYDNSLNSKPYSLEIYKDTDGLYKRKCDDYENDWGYIILFRMVLSTQEIRSNAPTLTAPATVINTKSALAKASDEYALYTSYLSFEITDGTDSAVITDGEKVSGSLDVTCNGNAAAIDAAPKYEFILPAISGEAEYTITAQAGTDGLFETAMKYSDDANGFFTSVKAEGAGTVTIGSQGNATTSFASDTKHVISATNNKITMPWYDLTFTTTDKGATVQILDDRFHVETATASKKADILVHGDINFAEFNGVSIPAGGADVKEDEGNCVVSDPTGTTIETKPYGFSVVFDTQGGTYVETLYNVAEGSIVAEPEKPSKEGFIFEGWFKDKDCTEAWDFANDKITADTIIYAGWSFNDNYYKTVTFIMKDGSQQRIHIKKKALLTPDRCPVIEGVKEQNWYLDEERTIKWNFDEDTVDDDVTLYCEIGRFKIDFDTDGAGTIDSMTIPEGTKVPEPAELQKEGYTFCGWYKDSTFSQEWDFEKNTVSEDMTLFAKWVATKIDLNDRDTSISIEIVHPYSYAYTGKAIIPQVIVRDGDLVLTEKTDYKISFKNNKLACDPETTTVDDSKKPQVIVQGLGTYKNEKPVTAFFSIMQADMADLDITVPEYVSVKGDNQLQEVPVAVKNQGASVEKKLYTVNYYTDEALTQKASGITTSGIYYVTVEAVKNGDAYTGNYKGVSKTFTVVAGDQTKLLSNMKVTFNKNVSCVTDSLTYEEVVKKLISKVSVGKTTYNLKGDGYAGFAAGFEVSIETADGNTYHGDRLYKGIAGAGEISVIITARADNADGYIGSSISSYTVKGAALKAGQFKLSYVADSKKPVTKAAYTGSKNLPGINTELVLGKDFTLTYMSGNSVITAEQVVNVGTYKVVVTGKGKYSGKVTMPFAITALDLSEAATAGRLKVSYEGTAVYDPKGSAPAFTLTYGQRILLEGVDYTISYVNNKKASDKDSYAYAKIKGKGNFKGTVAGDGKTSPTSSDKLGKGKLADCNFKVSAKSVSSADVTFAVMGIKKNKKGKVTGVNFKLYDGTKAIGKSDFTAKTSGTSSIRVTITGKGNYSGTRYETVSANLISVKDSKKVKVTIKTEGKFYYNGSRILPEITVTDADGNDISSYVRIDYDENIKVGKGKIYVTGKSSSGYCGRKTVTFTILPKWAEWIFG
ncbi:leucine-rich repeat protein [Butyrivibrio sp. MC2021]|uniref:leucine-rich repeat protein n=1 Tax=Butyrivibrio sp. MC2021 TaxID=1408306 RepID=UPI00047D4C59|nr:leucine-rich repeat protein [Butyrivibrio sp. MC2021]